MAFAKLSAVNYSEAIQFLYGLRLFGAKFGLENTFNLAALAGKPQDRLRFIHVAGTNGKGSTCAMLESIYRAAALRVGLFTSPHLVSFRERIQVNRQLISEADVVRLTEELRKLSSEFRLQAASGPAQTGTTNHDACPTFFEFVTVMALKFFAEQKCDLVIWETGLGGRLDATNIVMPLAGNPQDRLRFIHVAGTNGKGSTCAMLESIYRAAGLRVGLFTSPHLISFRERIQVNRQLIPEAAVVRLVGELQPLLKQFPTGHHPTFFEVVTVMALKFFAEQKCDLVIWETGLGGRLDATNIVTPLAGIITNIQFDHQQWLGDTLAKIAAEKAGIIKPDVPVITAADEPEALAVIEKTAGEKHAPLIKVGQASSLSSAGKMPAPPLIGDHQRLNAALALATVEGLQDKIPVSDAAMRNGLQNVNWPGR